MTMISPELQAEILALHFGGKLGTRAIATRLRINRKAVRRVLERRQVSLKPQVTAKRASILDPWKPRVDQILVRNPTLTVSRILQQLRAEGFLGGYTCVRTYVASHRERPNRPREAFLRLNFPPGEAAQVDWGEFGIPFNDGIKVHCFLMVLAHSRLLYIEFTRSEKFEEFIRCHENAFKYFGGRVPQEIWYDNLRSAVTERMGHIVRFNTRFMAYMGHHAIRPHACNPARGNEKGRVEDAVKYVRMSFWEGRQFRDFEDLCRQADQWRDEFANKREHRSTRRVPALLFEAEGKSLLRPMNEYPYDTREVFSRVVPPSFLVAYESNRYSVPWTLVGMTLTVRVGDKVIDCYYNDRKVASHVRRYTKNMTYESREHFKGLLERKPGASKESWQVQAVKNIGPAMGEYLNLLRSGHRSIRNEVSRILALATVFGDAAVNNAARDLLAGGIVGVDSLELALKSAHDEIAPAPIQFQNSKLNRVVPTVDLRRYDALLFASAEPREQDEALKPASNTEVDPNESSDDERDADRGPDPGYDPNYEF
jgi:transposase